MRVTNILLVEQHLMPDFAHPDHPPPYKHTHTHTNRKGHCPPNDLCPSHLQPTRFFFSIPITTNAQVFLSHNCPKIKENIYSISLESSNKPDSTKAKAPPAPPSALSLQKAIDESSSQHGIVVTYLLAEGWSWVFSSIDQFLDNFFSIYASRDNSVISFPSSTAHFN